VDLAERFARRIEVRLRARNDRNARAFGAKRSRARKSDAFAAACDENVLALEPEVHGNLQTGYRA
jgi:hypothetical protein